jgi:hypothetical protein
MFHIYILVHNLAYLYSLNYFMFLYLQVLINKKDKVKRQKKKSRKTKKNTTSNTDLQKVEPSSRE